MFNAKSLGTVLLLLPLSFAAGTRAQFDPRTPDIGPFPSDYLTVSDSGQRTGLRVNLPLPDCKALPSDCGEISLINQLDGFNPTGRMTVKFSAPVNPDTLRDGLLYIWLDPVLPGRFNLGPPGKVTVINQPVYDPATNTAYAKPDEILESGRRYLIVVTDKVRDLNGDPVEADPGFNLCLAKQIGGGYCVQLSDALTGVRSSLGSAKVVNASLFTTLAASAWFEQVQSVVTATPVNFTRTGSPNTLDMAGVQGAVFHKQTGTTTFTDVPLPVTAALVSQFGIGTLAFGSFQSPRFIAPTFSIPTIPTLLAPTPFISEEVFFHVWLPKSVAPARGYPVILAGHGLTDHSFGISTLIASANAAGYAVVGMNAVGHGNGPKSTIRLMKADGSVVEFPAPGRGLDLDQNGKIDDGEGCVVAFPGNPVGVRDCFRQTVVDFMQLIHGIRSGIDLDGDGRFDLDPTSINYFGQSLGSAYGAILTAVSPDISAAVLNVPGGAQSDARLSITNRSLAIGFLALRQPSLLNKGADFADDIPLRFQPVRIRTVPGAAAIQDFLERVDWLESPASDVVLAPHIKSATLPGQPIKRVLFQMAIGDQSVANPSTTSLIHAANLTSQVSLYRFDIAKSIDPTLPANPHTFLVPLGSNTSTLIGFAALQQGFRFLASGSTVVPDVNPLVKPLLGKDLFEEPPVFLPEQ